jgi:glycosyltransferase involved in cell wall biosynthesis
VRLADHVITVNDLIGNYAAQFNSSVTVIPMFVDTDQYRPCAERSPGPPRLAWSGSRSTMSNLQSIAPALRRLQAETGVSIRIVGEGSLELAGVSFELRQFTVAREATDLLDSDIGLVPLPDVPWNHWKFFFKAVQYMAVGLPVVAQRMGSNASIIEDGVNGFLVETQDQWYDRLRTLVEQPDLRRRMGAAARATVVERFSADVHMPRVAAVFDASVEGWTRRRMVDQRL